MRNFFLSISILAVALMGTASAVGQEATRNTEADAVVAAKPVNETAEAIKAQTEAVKAAGEAAKEAAAAQLAATKANTAAVRKAADDAAQNVATESARSTENTATQFVKDNWIVIVGVLFIAGVVFGYLKRKKNPPTGVVRAIGFALLAASLATSAKAACPAPFGVTSLSVVADPTKPEAPKRVMIMPGQTRQFAIGGCNFGWNEHNVVVGFTGGPSVVIKSVIDTKIVIEVTPAEGFSAPQYLNLGLRVRGDLLNTPQTLEVQPPASYAALQAAERNGLDHGRYSSGPSVDRTARASASAASVDATSAKNGLVTMNEKFERMFGTDGKHGSVGSEVVALRNDMNGLKSRVAEVENELKYDDGSSVIDDLSARIKALEDKGDAVSREDFDALKAQVEKILGAKFKTGMFHSSTIGDRVNGKSSKARKAKGGPTRHEVEQ